MVKRGFKGDSSTFEAAVSEDGKLMVVLDTRQDEKVGSSATCDDVEVSYTLKLSLLPAMRC